MGKLRRNRYVYVSFQLVPWCVEDWVSHASSESSFQSVCSVRKLLVKELMKLVYSRFICVSVKDYYLPVSVLKQCNVTKLSIIHASCIGVFIQSSMEPYQSPEVMKSQQLNHHH